MSSIERLFPAEETQREAHATLLQIAGRRTGPIPPGLLVAHVLEVYREAEWPVQRAAMEALLRRMETARQEGLCVATRPARRRALGLYRTRPRKGSARPYRSALRSLVPLRGSCDCADFVRSSLGLCKHLLVVLDALAARPRDLERELDRDGPRTGDPDPPLLVWDPIRPLEGRGSCLPDPDRPTHPGATGVRWPVLVNENIEAAVRPREATLRGRAAAGVSGGPSRDRSLQRDRWSPGGRAAVSVALRPEEQGRWRRARAPVPLGRVGREGVIEIQLSGRGHARRRASSGERRSRTQPR